MSDVLLSSADQVFLTFFTDFYFTNNILHYKSNDLFGDLVLKSTPGLTLVDEPALFVQCLLTEVAILLMNMKKVYSPVLCSIPLIYDTSNNR